MGVDDRTPYITITMKEALKLAHAYGKNITNQTLVKWIDEHEPKLGHQPGGNGGLWYIFKYPFIAHISGQEAICNDLLNMMAKGEFNGETTAWIADTDRRAEQETSKRRRA